MNDIKPFKLNMTRVKYLELRLRTSEAELLYFIKNKHSLVKKHDIPKIKNRIKKIRTVYDTSFSYKKLLRKINKELLNDIKFPAGVLGGIPGHSIRDLAKRHCTHESIYSLDLKDFFQNVKSGRVFQLFKSSGCTNEVSGILTDLVTFNGILPQGFPTSMMVANWIAFNLDLRHLEICKNHNLTRSRWVDDIIFSGRISDMEKVTNKIKDCVRMEHFLINKDKEHFYRRNMKPSIVGLQINSKTPKIPDAIISKMYDIIETYVNFGETITRLEYEDHFLNVKNIKNSIIGSIKYFSQYNKADANKMLDIINSYQIDYLLV